MTSFARATGRGALLECPHRLFIFLMEVHFVNTRSALDNQYLAVPLQRRNSKPAAVISKYIN